MELNEATHQDILDELSARGEKLVWLSVTNGISTIRHTSSMSTKEANDAILDRAMSYFPGFERYIKNRVVPELKRRTGPKTLDELADKLLKEQAGQDTSFKDDS